VHVACETPKVSSAKKPAMAAFQNYRDLWCVNSGQSKTALWAFIQLLHKEELKFPKCIGLSWGSSSFTINSIQAALGPDSTTTPHYILWPKFHMVQTAGSQWCYSSY
jgi:hypothetical protein